MILPPWAYAAAGGVLLLSGFGAGWQVRAWKCDAAQLKVEKTAVKETKEQQAVVHTEAAQHAQESQDAAQATSSRTTEIRTIYKDVAVPSSCEPPAAAVRVLDDAVASATARAGGKPGTGLPPATASSEAAGRP